MATNTRKKKVKMKPKQRVFTCASSPTTGIESKAPHRSTYFADGSYYLISLSFGAVEGGLSGRFVLESMLFAKGFDSTVTRFHAIDRRERTKTQALSGRRIVGHARSIRVRSTANSCQSPLNRLCSPYLAEAAAISIPVLAAPGDLPRYACVHHSGEAKNDMLILKFTFERSRLCDRFCGNVS
jgi:hypothetical protein